MSDFDALFWSADPGYLESGWTICTLRINYFLEGSGPISRSGDTDSFSDQGRSSRSKTLQASEAQSSLDSRIALSSQECGTRVRCTSVAKFEDTHHPLET
jgi:hypothetical protein